MIEDFTRVFSMNRGDLLLLHYEPNYPGDTRVRVTNIFGQHLGYLIQLHEQWIADELYARVMWHGIVDREANAEGQAAVILWTCDAKA